MATINLLVKIISALPEKNKILVKQLDKEH